MLRPERVPTIDRSGCDPVVIRAVHTRGMLLRPHAPAVVLTALVLALAGCGGGEPAATPEPTASADSSAETDTEPTAEPSDEPSPTEAASLALECQGEGTPTVVFEAGLNTSGDAFSGLVDRLTSTRVCTYDRAGVGASPPLADTDPDPWPGSSADALAIALEEAGEQAPYVVVGWSYGGMVAQAFATRHADLTAGLVLEDSSVPEQFEDPEWGDIDWVDGGRDVDTGKTVDKLSAIDLGDLPLVVLTQDQLPRRLATLWDAYHDRLAAASGDAVHVRAVDGSHELHESAQDLVLQAVEEVAGAVAAGEPLKPCDDRFAKAGGRCL